MRRGDLRMVAGLSEQLGYPVGADELLERFTSIIDREDHGLFVCPGSPGWVHVFGVTLLESEGYAEVGGLVVDQEFRRRGVGRILMLAAEDWALEHGHGRIRLYSGAHRKEAYAFYPALGYQQPRPGMFQKRLK